MQQHFGLMGGMLKMALDEMIEGLREGLQRSKDIFPKKGKINLTYARFEIFAYLLFRLDCFMVTCQDQKLRKPLFNFIADNMLQASDIERRVFNNTLNIRMQEYVGIQTDGRLTAEEKIEKLLQGFLGNLTYSVSEQSLFQWEGNIKPLPFLGADEVLQMQIIFRAELMPVELTLSEVIKSILTADSDFTSLSIEKINSIVAELHLGPIRQTRRVHRDIQAPALKQANKLLDSGDLFLAGEILMAHLARLSPKETMTGWEEIRGQVATKNRSMELSFKAIRDELCSVYRTTNIEIIEGRILEQIHNQAIGGKFMDSRNKRIKLAMTTSQTMKRWMELQDETLLPTFRRIMHYTDEIIALIEHSLKAEELQIAGWMINEFYPAHMTGKYDGISLDEEYGKMYHIYLRHFADYTSPYDIPYSYTEVENGEEVWEIDQNDDSVFSEAEEDSEDSMDEEEIAEDELNHDADEVLPRLITSYERIGAKGRIRLISPLRLLGAYESVQKYIIEMEHFKAFSKLRNQVYLLYNNSDVRLAIQQYHGDEALQTLDRFLHSFTRSGTIESQQLRDVCLIVK